MLKRIFPFDAMGLDTLAVFFESDQMGNLMHQGDQKLVLVGSRIDRDEMLAIQ